MAEAPEPEFELLDGVAAFTAKAIEMVSSAYMDVALLTQELDRRIYGTDAFQSAARKFVLQHEHTKLRALVAHPQRAIANGGRLIEFVRAMSSRMQFRDLARERAPAVREEYLIADGRTLLYRETPDDLELKYYAKAPHVARLKLKDFDTLWNEAEPSQELRRL